MAAIVRQRDVLRHRYLTDIPPRATRDVQRSTSYPTSRMDLSVPQSKEIFVRNFGHELSRFVWISRFGIKTEIYI